jgi:hypothetical protein
MSNASKLLYAIAGLLLLLTTPLAAQQRSGGIRHGMLTCNTSPSVGFIVGSRQNLSCQFKSSRGWTENYVGTLNRVGLDIGVTGRGVMGWAVFAATRQLPRGSLTGRFAGASGEATLGVGAGANVLVGGTGNAVSLQPVSLSAQTGVNLAVGVASLTLEPARR